MLFTDGVAVKLGRNIAAFRGLRLSPPPPFNTGSVENIISEICFVGQV